MTTICKEDNLKESTIFIKSMLILMIALIIKIEVNLSIVMWVH